MPRYASGVSYQFGPGGMTPAIRALLYINIAVFLLTEFGPDPIAGALMRLFGLWPSSVMHGWIWQLATYLFLHGGPWHILFNMLNLWMFGVELERRWGTQGFLKYFFITGIGAGVVTVFVSFLPIPQARGLYDGYTIGASGAVMAVILAWAVIFPDRTLMFMMMFPLRARVYAALMAAIVFYSAIGSSGSGIAHFTHLGGLVVGYLYLKGPRGPRQLRLELQYRLSKWRMERMRRKFDVHRGGRVH
jgi:membrane associated rhomboid family serine protease